MAEAQLVKEENSKREKVKGIRILLHSKKRIASLETLSHYSDSAVWDNGCTDSGDAKLQCKLRKNYETQVHKINAGISDSLNFQPMRNQRQESICLIEAPRICNQTPSRILKLTSKLDAGGSTFKNTSITSDGGNVDILAGRKISDMNKSDNGAHTENGQDKGNNISLINNKPKRRRGRPRKGECAAFKEENIVHTCTRVIRTKSRTIIQRGECNCVCDQVTEDGNINTTSTFYEDHGSKYLPGSTDLGLNINKQKCLEGNFDDVKDYVSRSSRVRDPYKPWQKNYAVNGTTALPEYKIQAQIRRKRLTALRANQRYSVFHNWESVVMCKNRVEEETRSRYNLYSRTNGFKDNKPKPNKRVLFELKRSKGDSVIVPYSGVPLMWIGNQVYSCHLGKPRFKTKDKFSVNKKSYQQIDDLYMDRPKKSTPSKKVGCPATFSVTKIARFPDFEVNDESKCSSTVSAELRNAWAKHPEKVRFYVEYYVKRPRLEDHQGHIFGDTNLSAKFQEPVDPRILQKIHELTGEGVTELKQMKEHISSFVTEEMLKGCDPPSLDRRRYNPRLQDYRNAMRKARLQLLRMGRSTIEIQCSALIKNISEIINTNYNENYLGQLKEVLSCLFTTLRDQAPLEPFLACCAKTTEQQASGLIKKTSSNKMKREVHVLETPSTPENHYSLYVSHPAQSTQVVYQDELPQHPQVQLEGLTQIYYHQQMLPEEEIYTTEIVDDSAE